MTNEKTPTNAKNSALAAAVACCSPAVAREAADGVPAPRRVLLRRGLRQRPGHDDRTGRGQERQRADRPAPAERRRRERDPDAPDDPTAHQRRDVEAHRAAAEARTEDLDDVRRADGQQPGHAQALERAAREQDPEGRREGRGEGRDRHERAGEHERALTPPPVRQRAPQPRPAGEDHDDHGHRQPRLGRAHVEVARQLGQDRLRRVHDGEHACGAQEEAGQRRAGVAHPRIVTNRPPRAAPALGYNFSRGVDERARPPPPAPPR